MTREEMRIKTVENVIKRLRCDGSASKEIQAILRDESFRLWLDTWVIPSLELSNSSRDELRTEYKFVQNLKTAFDLSQ